MIVPLKNSQKKVKKSKAYYNDDGINYGVK